jgi:succinate dehydrogenase / fumarate reductase cytochrome b subunit
MLFPAYDAAVGKKAAMATTGIILLVFVVLHMVGNLKLYQGPEKLNAYAEWLREIGTPALPHAGLLWMVRVVLLVAVTVHIAAAIQLTVVNRRARPVKYVKHKPVASDYAARTMRWSGAIVLLFIVYHLLHFTWGTAHADFRPGDVFHNVVGGFSSVWVSAVYITAQLALGLHLYHGIWSLFQSLGWSHSGYNHWRRVLAIGAAIAITAGNVSFPIAVLSGFVP